LRNQRSAISVEILSTAAQLYNRSHLKRLARSEWLWRSHKVLRNSAIRP